MIGPESSQEEKDDFRRETGARAVIFVEAARRSEIETCRLYQYEFDTRHFYPIDYSAGYYISEEAEHPISRTPLTNLLDLLKTSGVDLHWVPRLEQYRRENAESSYRFSNIRMRFADDTA